MSIERSKLPFRKNCEGYFLDKDGNILAKNMNSYLSFPGGGVDSNENIEEALIRETLEETGAVVKNICKIGELKFIWGRNWAKTEKQNKRYLEFQGEDMHFFTGKIDKFVELKDKEEDFWNGGKLINLQEAINIIESGKPFDEDIKNYREAQLNFLKIINLELIGK